MSTAIKRHVQHIFLLFLLTISYNMGRGKPITEEVRKIIIANSESGKSTYQIAKNLLLPRSTIQSIIQHYKKNATVSCLKRIGRPRLTSEAENRVLKKIIKKNRRARAGELTVQWRDMIQKDVSVDTCKRVLKRMGYGFYTAKEKPLLTSLQKKKRLKFARDHLNWTADQWRQIIWSDESKFEVTVGDVRKKVIRNKDEAFHKDCIKRKVKFPGSVMIWGCMSAQGVGRLHFIEDTVNAVKYQNILETSLLPSISILKYQNAYIFQQDGASCHTARTTKAWLDSKRIPTMEWPSSSPDLSPIETLWWKIKKKLRKYPSRSINDLKEKIKAVWDSTTPEECEELIATMPIRIKAVIESKGDITKW